jgi:hypothetical protein
MDLEVVGVKRQMKLSELDEWHEKSYHNAKMYKERTKRWHDKRIKTKNFTPEDKVFVTAQNVPSGLKFTEWAGTTVVGGGHCS